MPAEWETHAATWLAWPHEKTDWPGKFAPIPWVYADIVRHLSQVERVRILVESADSRARGPPHPETSGRESLRRGFFPCAHQSRMDSRFRPDFRAQHERRNRRHELALQRVGKIRRLEKRRRGQREARAETEMEHVVAGISKTPRRAGRRQHRRQWPGHDAHDRGMPAEPDPGAQSRRVAQGTGSHLPRLSRRDERSVAQKRHRRRRHARPRRRSRALRESHNGRHRRRKRSLGSELSSHCRKISPCCAR